MLDTKYCRPKASFAFEYDHRNVLEDLDWFSRFELFVPAAELPREATEKLHAAGVELLLYTWMPAFWDVEVERKPWFKQIVRQQPELLLNCGRPALVGSRSRPAWFFDLGNPECREVRARNLKNRLDESGFDGLFFDCLGTFDHQIEGELERINAEFERRHPGSSIQQAIGEFLVEVRKIIGTRPIFTNQGYKQARDYLSVSDFDLSENFITTHAKARHIEVLGNVRPLTRFHAFSHPDLKDWSSTAFMIQHCIVESLALAESDVEVRHLSYSLATVDESTGEEAPDREAIFYAFTVARLFGHWAYVRCENAHGKPWLNHDEVYFVDLGEPCGDVIWVGEKLAYRFFENGLVAVNGEDGPRRLTLEGNRGYFDVFEQKEVASPNLVVPVTVQLDGVLAPCGRVYLICQS